MTTVHERAQDAREAIAKAIKAQGWAEGSLWDAYDVARLDCIAESYRAYLPKPGHCPISGRATFQRGSGVPA